MDILENKKILIIGKDNSETIQDLLCYFKKVKVHTSQFDDDCNYTQLWSTNSLKTTNIELLYNVDYYIFTSDDALFNDYRNTLVVRNGLYLIKDLKQNSYFYILK